MMRIFKVTKYPWPGHDSWTAISDIGEKYPDDHEVLTQEEYLRVEDLYCKYVLAFWGGIANRNFSITYIEDDKEEGGSRKTHKFALKSTEIVFKLGDVVDELSLDVAVRMNLRELIYTRFKSSNGCELFFGYDFYMYVGVPDNLVDSVSDIYVKGLFVEALNQDPRE
jgi:hypothetical protein